MISGMKIHGIVYIIVGAFIAGFSYYVAWINEGIDLQKFMLFIWTGAIFAVVGLSKIIVRALSRPKKPKLAKENFPHHQSLHQQTQPEQRAEQSFIKFCSRCGSAVRHFDRFCYKCGSRVFHRK